MLLWELNKKYLHTVKLFADFFLPRFCESCKENLNTNEQIICQFCYSKIKRINQERIKYEYDRKFDKEKLISDFKSLFIFEKDKELQSIIHALKYNGKFKIGIYLGSLLATELLTEISDWNANLIMPVPLHNLKKAERGYNQSYFIGKGIKSVLNIGIDDKTLKRKKYTESQTTMTLIERKENIRNAFEIKCNKKILDKNIIIVDDVITTGATISECAKLLLENGANRIFALSVALAD